MEFTQTFFSRNLHLIPNLCTKYRDPTFQYCLGMLFVMSKLPKLQRTTTSSKLYGICPKVRMAMNTSLPVRITNTEAIVAQEVLKISVHKTVTKMPSLQTEHISDTITNLLTS